MIERRMDALKLQRVVRVCDVHRPQVFGAESGQTLFSDRDADLFDRVDVRHLVEDFLLVCVKGEECQVLRVEQTKDVLVQVEKNLVEIAGRVDLTGDPLDMLSKFHFLLQFLQVLRRRFGLHLGSSEDTRSMMRCGRRLEATEAQCFSIVS